VTNLTLRDKNQGNKGRVSDMGDFFRMRGCVVLALVIGLTACGGAGEVSTPPVVVAAPTLTTQPASVTVTAGQSATFTVQATGSGLTYQWLRNDVAISGATAAGYTTPAAVAGALPVNYAVTVTNTAGSVRSNTAVLTVQAAGAVSLVGRAASLHLDLPTLGTPTSETATRTVDATEVEFPSGSVASTQSGVFVIGVDIDVQAQQLVLSYTQTNTPLQAAFNGYVFDFDPAGPVVTAVSLDAASSAVASQFTLGFEAHRVTINGGAVPRVTAGDKVIVNLQFAQP
jgi:predicted small lipoprotein YifL